MKVNDFMAVVYKHTRLDTGDVFYIGIGRSVGRAYDTRSRNKHWKRIYNKADVSVEVIVDNISYEEAKSWEIYLVGLYGRKDLDTGILANMTDGGDGGNKSREAIQKQLETAKRNGTYDEMIKRISEAGKNMKRTGLDSHVRKEVYLFGYLKEFVGKFDTMTMCGRHINSCVSHLSKYMNGAGSIKGYFVFDHMPSVEELNIIDKYVFKPLSVKIGDDIVSFKSMADAARYFKTDRSYIHRLVKSGANYYKGYKLIY